MLNLIMKLTQTIGNLDRKNILQGKRSNLLLIMLWGLKLFITIVGAFIGRGFVVNIVYDALQVPIVLGT